MKTVAPDYYPDFRCKADKCKHTCCAGWEIDIDEETYETYMRLGGKLGEKLSRSISADGTPHFLLEGEDERCPMLDESGLCRLITEYGKETLCQICADHPRFRNYYSDRTEIGLGLCCEAAGELILGRKEKTGFITLSDDGKNEPLSDEEARRFETRNTLLDILQNRTFSFDERMKKLLSVSGLREKRSIRQLADFFLSLERLDEKGTALLLTLRETDLKRLPDLRENEQIILEQFAIYLIFRYTPYLDSKTAVLSVSAMVRIFGSLCIAESGKNGRLDFEKAVEFARLLSSEVEYSDENVERLFA